MSYTTTTLVIKIIGYVWALTIGRSILVMLFGAKLFKKAARNEKSALIPVINLFTLLEISDFSTFYGILFFVPIANLIVLSILSWKLGTVFNTTNGFKIGLVLFPIIFYPMLSMSDKPYKLGNEAYFKMMDDAHEETPNLMTPEEIKQINQEVNDTPEVEVDSIFKGSINEIEKVGPYKATKIDPAALDKLRESSAEDDTFTPIKRIDDIIDKPNYTPVNRNRGS